MKDWTEVRDSDRIEQTIFNHVNITRQTHHNTQQTHTHITSHLPQLFLRPVRLKCTRTRHSFSHLHGQEVRTGCVHTGDTHTHAANLFAQSHMLPNPIVYSCYVIYIMYMLIIQFFFWCGLERLQTCVCVGECHQVRPPSKPPPLTNTHIYTSCA